MVQCYSIILWKKAEKNDKSFNQIAEDAFSVLEVFKNFSSEFRPNFLSAASKKEVREFDWDYNSFYSLLKSGVNKEGKEIFEDLGYSVSFFSSKEDEKSCGINLHVGAKNERLLNTLIVDLPISFDMCKVENAKIIYDLFSGLVNVFRPFWGCVSDNILSKRYRPFLKDNKPTSIHWINYLSEEVCNRIGKEEIARLLDEVNTMTFNSGILMARNRAFDINNPEDVLYYEEMQKKYLKSEV